MHGRLYVVGTPIGNLEDMSFRAVRILKEADICLAEDTRHTKKLFSHYDIHTELLSCYRYNEKKRVDTVCGLLDQGKTIALVSDAGMPGISDPGEIVIRSVIERGYALEVIPGASSVLVSLLMAGFRTDQFSFYGFIPRKGNKRNKRLRHIADSDLTAILFESPLRLESLLKDTLAFCGDRKAAVCRELTKMFESVERGTINELLIRLKQKKITLKGECVLVVEGKDAFEKNQE